MKMRSRMRMNMMAMLRWLDHCLAGGEIPERLRPVSAEPRRDDLIFWLLFDQAKSSIHYNNRKKNENENVKENEYCGDDSLSKSFLAHPIPLAHYAHHL